MTIEVRPAAVDVETLRCQISDKYTAVASEFHTGKPLGLMLGYPEEVLRSLPAGTVESFAGTGNPFSMGELRSGETVLDIGCGAGFDSLIAARQVGGTGRVVSVDLTPAMLDKAAAGAREAGIASIEFREGLAEALPVDDASIDVVISDGVINLCPDKMAVMQEVYRVLKPGGRVQIADIVVHKELPQDAKDDIDLWSGWIAGALLEAEWEWVLEHSGFTDIRWGKQTDVFSGSKHESDAAEFETRGITFSAIKQSG